MTGPRMTLREGNDKVPLMVVVPHKYNGDVDEDKTDSDSSHLQNSAPYCCPSSSWTTRTRQRISDFLNDASTRAAFPFAMRMAVLLTISSAFVLIRTSSWKDPDGMSVLVTVLFVCWFPTLDSGMILEKIVQRLIGTFIGAAIGLSCGFLSIIVFHTRTQQAFFLGVCMFVVVFGVIFFAGRVQVGKLKVIKRFNYATILCILTFCICVLPFACGQDPKWARSVARVVNVIVGCILGAVGSLLIFPKSTVVVLHEKTANQVKLAGQVSNVVLHSAADIFSGRLTVHRLADELLEIPLESDMTWQLVHKNSSSSSLSQDAMEKYEEAIADWNASKALIPLARYGPFHLKRNFDNQEFELEMARTLARSLRIQTTAVVLDGMVRNEAEYDFANEHVLLFQDTGTLLQSLLSLPLDPVKNNDTVKQLFQKVQETRRCIEKIKQETDEAAMIRQQGLKDFEANLLRRNHSFLSVRMQDDMGMGLPKYATGGKDNALVFLQLVEHLILRCLRLYQAWKQVEVQAVQLRDKYPSIRSNLKQSHNIGNNSGNMIMMKEPKAV